MIKEITYNKIEISESKLIDYLLNKNHSVGAHKAIYFEKLGYDVNNWQILRESLLEHLETSENVDILENQFGVKIVIINKLKCINGKEPEIKSVWFIENKEIILKFVTAYPEK